jgi:alpha-L-arabinofuranosidase
LGHPAPFNLKILGVGNENWGPQYLERLAVFTKAIKAKYPKIKLVNSSGTDPVGERFDYLNNALRKAGADLIDEHYYRRPEWFLQNAARYDNYPRNGSKIFAGEYAAQSDRTVSVNNRNNLLTALSEAAFMTGLERNADVVQMASYAPLFAHADGWQWAPDLIWVDNLQAVATPDYHVQKMFSLYKGSKVIPITVNSEAVAGQDSLYASAVVDTTLGEVIIKVVNMMGTERQGQFVLEGIDKMPAGGTLIVLKSNALETVNSFANPTAVAPVTQTIAVNGKELQLALAPYSFSVIRIQLNNGRSTAQ